MPPSPTRWKLTRRVPPRRSFLSVTGLPPWSAHADTGRAMSQENLELAARWYESWATSKAEVLRDMARVMELCHPEVEWHQRVEGWAHRGREDVREGLERWLDSFDDYRFEVQRIVDCGGDEVLVVGLEVARGATSGAEVRSVSYELLTIHDRQIVRFRDFYDETEALEAAGLRDG